MGKLVAAPLRMLILHQTGLEASINSDPSSSSRVSRYPFLPIARISDVHGDGSRCYLYNAISFGCVVETC